MAENQSSAAAFLAAARSVPLVTSSGAALLAPGGIFQAQVTGLVGERLELLIGNQYFLASSVLHFEPGATLQLRLVSNAGGLYHFQFAPELQPLFAEGTSSQLDTLLRALGQRSDAQSRAALQLLLQAGLPVTSPALAGLQQVLSAEGAAVAFAFLPLYRELLQRELQLPAGTLRRLALLAAHSPLAGQPLLSFFERRTAMGRGSTRRGASPGVGQSNMSHKPEEQLPAGPEELARALYASPERAIASAQQDIELTDLVNIEPDEEVPTDLQELLLAQRLRAALGSGPSEMLLPAELEDELLLVQLAWHKLTENYYQREGMLSLSLESNRQGRVEVQFHLKGQSLQLRIIAEQQETLDAYAADLPRLKDSLSGADAQLNLLGISLHCASPGPSCATCQVAEAAL